MARLRFGVVSESVRAGRAWLDFARQVEDTGIDVLLLRDHFSAGAFGQQLAPFTSVGAGWYQPEYAAAGIAFEAAGRRIARLDESLSIIGGLIGGPDQIRSDLAERRDRFGLSYLVAGEASLPALAKVANSLAASGPALTYADIGI
jgi:alkanesulfonate monooxygenase SsuD/methylene tetrahydromethanopterin reductase-like flavin-dependent oxidoreductase (luciferase family)